MRLAAAGETGPLWVQADIQTHGRGRAGRSWVSPEGNLFSSLLTSLDCPAGVVHQLSLVAGAAVIDAVTAAAAARGRAIPNLRLKWPNDAMIGSAKFVGILPESLSANEGTRRVVVFGIGINLANHPPGLDRDVTDLSAHGLVLTPDDMLSELATAMDVWLARWDNGANFSAIRSAWLERAGPIGESMSINTGHARIVGEFAGLDADGALLLNCDGRNHRFTYGDVTLHPPVGGDRRHA
jgi:BirA family transcriptional regulator, biotin operon repressor / biotin---[acetyl-CoA-carboxylase] ligase